MLDAKGQENYPQKTVESISGPEFDMGVLLLLVSRTDPAAFSLPTRIC
jgi:hypothetical protein